MLATVLLLAACSETNVNALNQAPDAAIVSPEPGVEVVFGGPALTVTGVIGDDRDAVRALQVEWTLDDAPIEGSEIADGGAVTVDVPVDGLARGAHVVELTVTDREGLSTDVFLELSVIGPAGAPVVEITAPETGASFGLVDEITFRGLASDTFTAPEDLVFRWSSDLDGPLGGALSASGESVLFATLSEGTHRVTLDVVDEDGEVGTDSIAVLVGPPEIIEPQPGDLVFTEMMINPQAVADDVGEWVELTNTSGSPIDIAGYSFRDDDNDAWVLSGPFVVPPGGTFVLCASMDLQQNGGVVCDGTFNRATDGSGMAFANRPDEIVLARPDGVEIARINYTDAWFTNGVATGMDPAVLGTPSQTDKDHWCDQTTLLSGMSEPGTPGIENDACL